MSGRHAARSRHARALIISIACAVIAAVALTAVWVVFLRGSPSRGSTRRLDVGATANVRPRPAPSPTRTLPSAASFRARPCGRLPPPPAYRHVIWIWFENKALSSVIGNAAAPFVTRLATEQCAYSARWMDDVVDTQVGTYVAATAGANCDSGTLRALAPPGDRCVTIDDPPPATCVDTTCHATVATTSIFEELQHAGKSWRAYEEGMPRNCSAAYFRRGYDVEHNPPMLFSHIRVGGAWGAPTCSRFDLGFPTTVCNGVRCAIQDRDNPLARDLRTGDLPAFSFVTPNLCGDMHDSCPPYASKVTNGDQWLAAWIPRITGSPAYRDGSTAVFVMWDEGAGGTFGTATPNVIVAPSVVPGTVVHAVVNNVAALRATETMLGVPLLGCASGHQANGKSCPPGSTADLAVLFHL